MVIANHQLTAAFDAGTRPHSRVDVVPYPQLETRRDYTVFCNEKVDGFFYIGSKLWDMGSCFNSFEASSAQSNNVTSSQLRQVTIKPRSVRYNVSYSF